MKTFKVKISIKNNRLIKKREALGLTSKQLSEHVGISPNAYSEYECLKGQITGKKGQVLSGPKKLCAFYDCELSDLFPDEVFNIAATEVEREFDYCEVVPLLSTHQERLLGGVEAAVDLAGLREAIEHAMDDLDPREAEVLRLRYVEDMTLDEVAERLGSDARKQLGGWSYKEREESRNKPLTRESVRQIEERALRRLRHTSRSSKIEEFINI